MRWLQTVIDAATVSSTINPYTTIGAITWYIFLSVCCGVPMLCCVAGCSYLKLRKRRSSDEDLLDLPPQVMDSSLSRMEANIHVFSEQQELKRKQLLLKAFERHSLMITAQSLDANDSAKIPKISEGCTICLAGYQVGDVVVQSSNEACQHVFHFNCILQWLMTRQSPLCPCCRQTFIHDLHTTLPPESRILDEDSSEDSTFIDDSTGDSDSGRQAQADGNIDEQEPSTPLDSDEPPTASIELDEDQASTICDDEPAACVSLSPNGEEGDEISTEGQIVPREIPAERGAPVLEERAPK